jgi:hypothetical protein
MTRAPQPVADLTDQLHARGGAPELGEVTFHLGIGCESEIAREIAVTLLDLREHRLPRGGQRLVEQLLEAIRDSRQRGVARRRAAALPRVAHAPHSRRSSSC